MSSLFRVVCAGTCLAIGLSLAAGSHADNKEKHAYVCVVFTEGCPVDISDWDLIVDGETSKRRKGRIKWVHWLAVSEKPEPGQCGVSEEDVDEWDNKVALPFSVIFSPFEKGGVFTSDPGKPGKVESKRLRRNKKKSDSEDQEIPAGIAIEYKYTIFAPGCPDGPLDPRIRVR